MENSTPNTNAQSAENNTAAQQEKTFTQADVDKMIQSRLDRERKKMPSEEELNADYILPAAFDPRVKDAVAAAVAEAARKSGVARI